MMRCQDTSRGAAVVAAALVLIAAATAEAKPVACPPGRYIITQGAAIVVGDSAPQPGTVVLQAGQVALGSHCALRNGSIKGTKKGTTKVQGKWPSCGALRGVKLAAVIQPGCQTMSGTVRAKKTKPQSFQASLSRCGDQVIDTGGGEACDSGVGCEAGELCTGTCTCEPLPTTTLPPASTTTTTGTVTTTTALLCAPTTTTTTLAGLCGNGMVDPGETCDDGNTLDGDFCPSDCHIDTCTPIAGSARSFDVTFTPPAGKQIQGITVLVDYPEGEVVIPGSGGDSSVVASITHAPFGTLSSPNDLDYALLDSLVRSSPITPGRLFTIKFEECQCAPPASAADFTCTVTDAADPGANPVDGVTCAVSASP
jgi:cysteine-rich repeat protein